MSRATEISQLMHTSRWCYWIPADGYVEGHGYRVSVVFEHEAGHYPTGDDAWITGDASKRKPWFWGHDYNEAKRTAEEMNQERLGLSPRDVARMHHKATFPFRVDVDKGRFVAVDGDVQYIGETKAELVEHMKAVAAKKISLTWTRYIEIEYQVSVVKGPHRISHSGLGPDDDREGPATSISLDFEVVEYSSKFEAPGRAPAIARRKIGSDGKPYDEERRWEVPDDVIPFTPERLDALRHIQAALTAIDDRMRDLFAGKAKVVAARLDTITNQQLALPGPEPTLRGPSVQHMNTGEGAQARAARNGVKFGVPKSMSAKVDDKRARRRVK